MSFIFNQGIGAEGEANNNINNMLVDPDFSTDNFFPSELEAKKLPFSLKLDPQLEDESINIKFASVLKECRHEFGDWEIDDIVSSFKSITSQKILDAYDQSFGPEIVENWTLETKFWNLVEVLLEVKFSDGLEKKTDNDMLHNFVNENINSLTSNAYLEDIIISNDSNYKQLYKITRWIQENFELDLTGHEDDIELKELQTSKWLNTKVDIQAGARKPNFVKNLDPDAALRESTHNKINDKDKTKDDMFFKKAFFLLLSNKIDELSDLCESTGNWDFALTLTGLTDYVDPQFDLTGPEAESGTAPIGIKRRLLWKRTLFKLSQAKSLTTYERGCYGYLAGDFPCCEGLSQSWEKNLLIYLNNLLQNEFESNMIKFYQRIGKIDEIDSLSKLPTPPKVVNSISEALNLLAMSSVESIRNQSEHSVRVLMGSMISDNVKNLMDNSLASLDDLLSREINVNDPPNELTNDAYLLRILVHLAIILRLIYREEIISNHDYTKLLKSYITRLTLHKLYDQVPVYISFIPVNENLIDVYSYFLSNFASSRTERASQIKSMKQLDLPMEGILRRTVEKVFNETESFYPTDSQINLSVTVNEIDKRLYNSVYWLYDSGMYADCLEAIIMLFRRFLSCGKLASAIEFLDSIELPKLISDYKLKVSLIDTPEKELELKEYLLPSSILNELVQYQQLIGNFKLIEDYNEIRHAMPTSTEALISTILSVSISSESLLRNWLYELINDASLSKQELEVYQELRRIYIPTVFNTLFDILSNNRHLTSKQLTKQAVQLVNLLSDKTFKLYDILNSTNDLKPFLKKFALFSCDVFGEAENGIYL